MITNKDIVMKAAELLFNNPTVDDLARIFANLPYRYCVKCRLRESCGNCYDTFVNFLESEHVDDDERRTEETEGDRETNL